jgi:hypothetical protein
MDTFNDQQTRERNEHRARSATPCRMIVGGKKKEREKRKGKKNEYPRIERENSMADKISSQPLAAVSHLRQPAGTE